MILINMRNMKQPLSILIPYSSGNNINNLYLRKYISNNKAFDFCRFPDFSAGKTSCLGSSDLFETTMDRKLSTTINFFVFIQIACKNGMPQVIILVKQYSTQTHFTCGGKVSVLIKEVVNGAVDHQLRRTGGK